MVPVKTEDGHIESFILTVGGEDYTCRCGCNCFHKPDCTDLDLFQCNSCRCRFRRLRRNPGEQIHAN